MIQPRERKRIPRLLIEDVTLINGERIQLSMCGSAAAPLELSVTKPLPIA